MAVERAKAYELRQRQFEQSAVRFYSLAYHLLATEGGKYVKSVSGVYPVPLSDHGQGGGVRPDSFRRDTPYVSFGAQIMDDGEVSTVVLSSISLDKKTFKSEPKEISKGVLYIGQQDYFPSFDLHLLRGELGIDILMLGNRPVLSFDVGKFDPQKNTVRVYGKEFLQNGEFNLSISTDAFDEFDELGDLLKRLNADKDSYTKIYPKPKTSKLDKAHA